MGTIIGLVIGYLLGTRAGSGGYGELQDAWKTITTSEEVRDLLTGGLTMTGSLVEKGLSMVAERLQLPEDGTHLRSAA